MVTDLSASPEDYETIDAYAHCAIGGDDCGYYEAQYAIEPSPGDCARAHTDELAGAIEELPSYRAGARIIVRDIAYGPWRYVTPEEIEHEAQEWDA